MFSTIMYIVSVTCVCCRFPAWDAGVWGDKSQKLKWPGYGFYMEVPDGVPTTEVTVCQCGCKGDIVRPVQAPQAAIYGMIQQGIPEGSSHQYPAFCHHQV